MEDIKRIDEIVAALAPELSELTLNIHDNPELGGEEYKAMNWQCELLEKYGFETEKGFCDIPTAYRAVYKGAKPGPKIAMLAEYDALPELGHACGHSLIAMVSVGAGIAMREFADKYGAEIQVIGTPAEETKGAKVEMAAKGAFKGIDAAMMAHPAYISSESMNTCAICAFKLEFFGKCCHAAYPVNGINALDAMINFFNLVNAMRQQTSDDSRIHGIITNGGVAPNIVPDYTSAVFYTRANTFRETVALKERVIKCAEGAALATGCTVKVSKTEEDFKDTCSNMTLSDLASSKAEAMGEYIFRMGGKHVPGASDLGDVSYECPAIQLGFKMGDPPDGDYMSTHTADFCAVAGSQGAIEQGLKFVKVFVETAIDLMTKPELMAQVKAEFEKLGKEPEGFPMPF